MIIPLRYFFSPLLLFIELFICFSAAGRQVSTPYLSFQISDRWNCEKVDTFAFSCRVISSQPVRDAIIIISAKEAGPEDNFASFQKYLGLPKPLPVQVGKPTVSRVQYVNLLNINNQPWADSLHSNSEISGYLTRYLATVKEKLSILVTFSAAQNRWGFFEQDFKMAIQTLKLTEKSLLLTQPYTLGREPLNRNNRQQPKFSQSTQASTGVGIASKSPRPPNYTLLGLAILGVLGIVIYTFKN